MLTPQELSATRIAFMICDRPQQGTKWEGGKIHIDSAKYNAQWL